MLKALGLIGLGAALLAAGTIALGAFALASVNTMGVEFAEQFTSRAMVTDNLEDVRMCFKMNYAFTSHNATQTVENCDDNLSDWSDSPTFESEWHKLVSTDSEFAAIVAQYNEENPH